MGRGVYQWNCSVVGKEDNKNEVIAKTIGGGAFDSGRVVSQQVKR